MPETLQSSHFKIVDDIVYCSSFAVENREGAAFFADNNVKGVVTGYIMMMVQINAKPLPIKYCTGKCINDEPQ